MSRPQRPPDAPWQPGPPFTAASPPHDRPPVPLPQPPDDDPQACVCGAQFEIGSQTLLHLAAILPSTPSAEAPSLIAWHSPFNDPDRWCHRPLSRSQSDHLHAVLTQLRCPLHDPHHITRIPDSHWRLRLRAPCLDATWSWYEGGQPPTPAATLVTTLEQWIGAIDRRSWPQFE